MKFDDTLMRIVDADIKANLIPFLIGEPGIGKSSWVTALGQRNGTQVFVLACNQLADKADLTGARLVPIEGTSDYEQVFFPHKDIMDAVRYAKDHPREEPILFMDELNRTTPDVTSACLSIPTMRRVGNVTLPKNLRVIIAGNDKGNITSLDEASISRFVLYDVFPDTETFLGLDPNLNVFVKNVLTKYPDTIFCKKLLRSIGAAADANNDDDDDEGVDINEILDDAAEMNQITTPRTISGVSNWLNKLENSDLLALLTETRNIDGEEVSALQEALEGHTGKTKFTALLLADIASGINTVSNSQNAGIKPVEPQCYKDFKNCKDITALNEFIENMNDAERSSTMVYLLYEKTDNKVFIQQLANKMDKFMPNDFKTLMTLFGSSGLDDENYDTFLNCDSQVSTLLRNMCQ